MDTCAHCHNAPEMCACQDKPTAPMSGVALARQSECFKAYEWLAAEGLKGNKHAQVMADEIVRLNKDRR